MNFYKTIYSFIALYRSRTSNLILALLCFLLFALDSHAQTSQPTGYGGISGVEEFDRDFTFTQTEFGSSVVNMGDIDGNGTDDLAVGASRLTPNASLLNTGGVVILLMDVDDEVEAEVRITHGTGGLQLPSGGAFGISVANIGDFNGDGINELAVGTIRGKIYLLRLTSSGDLHSFSVIDKADINVFLDTDDSILSNTFGVSIANLGNIDNDGVIDLAVGAHRGDSGNRGSVHILFMDKTGTGTNASPTLKDAVKLNTTNVALNNNDQFGVSVANIGDLNQDEINDLAVGATGDDGAADNAGAVHIFRLDRDGSVKGSFKIFDDVFNGGDSAGQSITNLGDLNGDGINDIAVGASGADSDSLTIDNTGAVFTIFMGRTRDEITTNDFFKIDADSHSALNTLRNGDRFGQSIANIGDRDGNRINDLAVGAPGTSAHSDTEGVLYILYMDANTNIVNITSSVKNGRYDTGTIDIQVIFSEAVTVDTTEGTPSLMLDFEGTDRAVEYTMGSGSDTLIFSYTIATNDRATDLDYVDTTSLTLNDRTITASEAPSRAAILTLPEPGTRGSLSSNKNISIRRPEITNTAPSVVPDPIVPQELTVNIPFIYTIEVTDAQNDPITYTVPSLPSWLSFDADTGIFSGTPVDEQVRTDYEFTVSDRDSETVFTFTITVNAAPTLPMIDDIIYAPGRVPTMTLPAATGGTTSITYTLSPDLPDGLTFNVPSGSREISGTVPNTEIRGQQYTYTAADANGALAVQTFTITVEGILTLQNIPNKVYIIGNEVNQILPAATGGTGDIEYTLSPDLPEGLMFNDDRNSREISGRVPNTELRGQQYTYTAEDQNGALAVQTFTITINTLELETILNEVYIVGNSVTTDPLPAATGGTAGIITYRLSPEQSNGLTYDTATRIISGTPTDVVITKYTYTATDSSGVMVETNFILIFVAETNEEIGYGDVSHLVINERNNLRFTIDNGTQEITLDDARAPAPGRDSDTEFGNSVANLGDINGDGIDDLAVGAWLDDTDDVFNAGAVYILLMNRNGTVKPESNKIRTNYAGLSLSVDDRFGASVANLGDLDGNGINDLAVGAPGIDLNTDRTGAIYILYLDDRGELESFYKIDDSDPNINLSDGDGFGRSIANLGDIDGDGTDDLAVGAWRDDEEGTNRGAIYILFMNKAGTAPKAVVKLDNDDQNITLADFDLFGVSVAGIGDLNEDGINDLAVGAFNDSAQGSSAGTLHILYLNRDGSTNGSFEIQPPPSEKGLFGFSVANIGDLNEDGINDLAVGSRDGPVQPGFVLRGTIDIILMDSQPSGVEIFRPDTDTDYNLDDADRFGSGIASAGDLNEDGINDLAVGVFGYDEEGSGDDFGALYILYMDSEPFITDVTALEDGEHNTGETINIQIIFSEAVEVGTSGEAPTLTLATGNPDNSSAVYTSGSESRILTFVYTVVADDLIGDLGYVDTASLSLNLNGNTIIGIAVPRRAADLTLPDPGTRGSLSTNRNISINMAVPTNTGPKTGQPIPAQELTVNIPFTYTIPAGAFTDEQNDPLTYSISGLPDGIKLDADTGTFSGTPTQPSERRAYRPTASDGEFPISGRIFITVNAALTLSPIADINYSPGSGDEFTIQLPLVTVGTGTGDIKYTLSPVPTNELTFSTSVETNAIMLTPTAAEKTRTYTYTAEDQNGALAAQIFTITIKPLELPNILNKVESIGSTINVILPVATGGTGAIRYTLSPKLSEGLTFDTPTRTISGIPTVVDITEYTYTATDESEVTTTRDFILVILVSITETSDSAQGDGSISHFAINRINNLRFTITLDDRSTQQITLNDGRADADADTDFGSSIANLGDIDGNGTDDLAVGARQDDTDDVFDAGAVYILLMNADGTVKPESNKIRNNYAGLSLSANDQFGSSAANLGDLNRDGINELALAVGAPGDDAGGMDQGAIYILYLDDRGELEDFYKIDGSDPNINLSAGDGFGRSIANLGDIDGDGTDDLAVGAPGDDAADGTDRGAIYILFMNKAGTAPKAVAKLDSTDLDFDLADGDQFGISVAGIGDLNEDGINDLAVGVPTDDEQANNAGTLHILYLNRDGSVKPDGFEINKPMSSSEQFFGFSVANIGDLDKDNINDLAVGSMVLETGSIEIIFMDRPPLNAELFELKLNADNNIYNVDAADRFGHAIASAGDLNGDGINDLAVGVPGYNEISGEDFGALYILYMDAETIITAVTAIEDGERNTGEKINIQVIFSEPVDVGTDGAAPTLTLKTRAEGDNTDAIYTSGSGSRVLKFVYTVLEDDVDIRDLGYVDTASLSLNGNTIVATAAPNRDADLTLPDPGTRGSLSSNRNLSLNPTGAEENTAPEENDPLNPLNLQLTANTRFIYTIPADTFFDLQNDPLRYFPSTAQPLPSWLMLDATGTFSGTPEMKQDLTPYTYMASDGEFSVPSTIEITVNPAPLLDTMANLYYLTTDQIAQQLPEVTRETGTGTIEYTLSPVLPNTLQYDEMSRRITRRVGGLTPHTGIYTYTAQDQNGALAVQIFTIEIADPLDSDSLPNVLNEQYIIGSTVNKILPETIRGRGLKPITYGLSPELADGLTFDIATRTISGIPTDVDITEYTYTATDASGSGVVAETKFILAFIAETSDSAQGYGGISGFVKYDDTNLSFTITSNGDSTQTVNVLEGSRFGTSVANLGDIDKDGIDDLAVGAPDDDAGAVYILLMNADETVKPESNKIRSNYAELSLSADSRFGSSVANLGDLDDNGINELAVGAPGDGGGGAIYILYLDDRGELTSFSKIDGSDPNINLSDGDGFGISIANLGDIDGDGTDDLAVGAWRDDIDDISGMNRGAIYILFMDKIPLMNRTGGAPKAVAKLDSTDTNFALDSGDQFGASVAGIGDLNGDGVNDIVVGAPFDDGQGNNAGTVHILYLNRDGSTNGSFEINKSVILTIAVGDRFGSSVANLGDLNRDGINELAVGAPSDDTGGTNKGAIHILFLDSRGELENFYKLDDSDPNINLSDGDGFGTSIANIGDRNEDGIDDLAVGASRDGDLRGALYILYMDAETVVTDVTAAVANGIYEYETGAKIDIQVIFSEAVDVDATEGIPTLTLETGSTDTQASYIGKLGSRILTFEYTVGMDDFATDLDYDSTASLTLNSGTNSGTIAATDAPNYRALLTLPEPGTRGSLSSHKNLSINTTKIITNTAPRLMTPIENLELTANTSFTVTIPAGAFIDDQNDPLMYSSDTLPNWLMLDADTGTFSGTPPVTEQALTSYTYTVSDGTASINSTIGITVNAAPTLSAIVEGKIYLIGDQISETILPPVTERTGTKPIKYTLSPVLPSGLNFIPGSREITGTVSSSESEQTRNYTYTAEDRNGALTAQIFTIETRNPLALEDILNEIYFSGSTIKKTLPAATGGFTPISYALSPELPKGLTFSTETRMITGTAPAPQQVSEYTYTATDFSGARVETNFILTFITETSDPAQGYGGISGSVKNDNNLSFTITSNGDSTQTVNVLDGSRFGTSVANLGDIDKDGIDDLAVGAPLDDTDRGDAGAVYILLMNADETVKLESNKIRSNYAGLSLSADSRFGSSVANLGDLDGDRINELAVGAPGDGGGGAIYILYLDDRGELTHFYKIDGSDLNIDLSDGDEFGISIANLGDIDGDGTDDLAVGASEDNTGGIDRGAIHILFMDKTPLMNRTGGAPKAVVKLDSDDLNITLKNRDQFGASVAGIGDLNGDGVNDIAVGAPLDDAVSNNNTGALHILYLNRDGSVKPGSFEIDKSVIPAIAVNDQFGSSVANLGDLNGDGINDLAVGAPSDDTGGADKGAVYILFLDSRGELESFYKIDDDSDSNIDLSNGDRFGGSIANIGDRNGDGIDDLAVGASRDGSLDTGAFYILYMDAETVVTDVTAATAIGRDSTYITGEIINIYTMFSEAVNVSGIPTLSLETGSTGTQAASYISGSGSRLLTFAYTVVIDDFATDLDYVSSTALELNGGTIAATAAPNRAAVLTLPEPGTRGSLSSNKNIAINPTEAIPLNTAPRLTTPIETQELTVNTSFTVTIPAGTFIDDQNDPLMYSSVTLPRWLSIDADTGTFSGTPPATAEPNLTTYTFLVSDGTTSTESMIGITVNAAPILPDIENKIYLINRPVSETTLPEVNGGTGTKPIKYTLSPVLPDDLMFNSMTREITGTISSSVPEQRRNYTYTAEDRNGALTAQIFIIETRDPLALPGISNRIYIIGSTITDIILPEATGGIGDITYELSPDLPEELTFNADGLRRITGNAPAPAQTLNYTYTARTESEEQSQTFTIETRDPLAFQEDISTKIFIIGIEIDEPPLPAATGGILPIRYTLSSVPVRSPTLPKEGSQAPYVSHNLPIQREEQSQTFTIDIRTQ